MIANSLKTHAWILDEVSGPIRLDAYELRAAAQEEVLVEPLFVCWEGNMSHAVNRKPIDVCRARRERQVVLGNAGVVRVVSGGTGAVQPGDICFVFSGDTRYKMPYDYPLKAYAYDSPGSTGLLAKQSLVHQAQLFKIPENSKLSLQQWAAFSLRYVTAWGNWKVAKATYRSMVSEEEQAHPDVWAWGGGASLALLQLAQKQGFKATMITSQDHRLDLLKSLEIEGVDRRNFINLDARTESREYRHSEVQFLRTVAEKTNSLGVSIFADFIGEPVFKATLKALARPGVLSTAGWKEGMTMSTNRAIECMQWHAHVHTHYASLKDARDAMNFAEQFGWVPPLDANENIPSWHDLPDLIRQYELGLTGYFPLIEVNPL